MQGNVNTPKPAQPVVVAEGPFCLRKQAGGAAEPAAMPQSSPALAHHGSITKQELEPFIPANITPEVERWLHVRP